MAAQVAELVQADCGKIFQETASGAQTGRTQLGKALASLSPGHVLVVTRLDRLARSTRDLLNILDTIAKAGAGLVGAWFSLFICLATVLGQFLVIQMRTKVSKKK